MNLALPQFPAGTGVALVRQAILLDNEGLLVFTNLTESIQLRVYHAITPGSKYINYINGPSSHDQDFFQFRISRLELFANHNGGLVAVRPGQTEFATFSTPGGDAFEATNPFESQTPILQRCIACHADSGIHSLQSRVQWLKYQQATNRKQTDANTDDPFAWETQVTIARKQHQPELRLLERFWRAAPN